MNTTIHRTQLRKGAVGGFLLAALVAPLGTANAQSNVADSLEARRAAILQQDQLFTDDGQLLETDAVVATPTQSVPVQTVAWRGRYYRPSYYYGAPRARYYARYPSYYDNYNSYYGSPYYGGYGEVYRGGYYGRPGYYGYPYGAARVGPLRFYWR